KFNLRLLLQRVEISEPLVKSNWEAYQLDMRTAHRKFIFLRSDEQSKALGLSIAISELTVEKMPAKEWDRLVEVLDGWYFSSHLKYLSIHKELPLQSPLDHDPGGVFLSAHVICDLISRHLRNQENTENRLRSPRRVLVCRDRLRSVQAVALFNKKEHSLTYLVTHPDNIRHPINEHISTRAQGAGTQIILYLARLALKRNMPLWAIIRDDSEPFYQKLHFDDDAAFGKKILTVEKIKQLVSLKIFPFSLLSQ
ncbi:MAG: hypothetical protein K2P51_00005, partial [Rhabdochlamydiaceae bacterium]|nr:hypothetical protein [Rhabdochlamydiaceae bacterium]